jgi:multimeric flavodoxin WrbA
MRLLIHDLPKEIFEKAYPFKPHDVEVIWGNSDIQQCMGCFKCWTKTPGSCVIRDSYGDMGELLSKCEQLTLISRCFYGSYSPFVKNVLDRSISYVHPYFVIRNGEMHHKRRYDNRIILNVYFYGEDISREEMDTANRLVRANAINLDCETGEVVFVKDPLELGGQVQ